MHLSLKGSMDRQPLTDRLGDKLLAEYGGAAAAYSLRSLSGDQTTVVRVRRSSDNAEKDFTASEMGAALEDWVNTDYEVYSSDFSTTQSWTSPGSTVTITSEDSIGGLNDVLGLDCSGTNGRFGAYKLSLGLAEGEKHSVTFRYYTTDSSFSSKYWNVGNAYSNVNVVTSSTNDQIVSDGTWREVTLDFNNENSGLRIKVSDASGGAYGSLLPDLSGSIYIRDVVLTTTHANGYVETWYDQSGNGNDATQTVAASQPKIVDAGAYLGELDFDGTDDFLETNNSDLCNISELSLFTVLTGIKPSSRDVAVSAGSVVPASTAYGGWQLSFDAAAGARLLTQALGSSAISTANKNFSPGEHLVTSILNVPNGTTSVDSVEGTTNTSMIEPYNNKIGRRKLRIGCEYTYQPSRHYSRPIKEVIFYTSDQSANRTAIEANINNHYSIY